MNLIVMIEKRTIYIDCFDLELSNSFGKVGMAINIFKISPLVVFNIINVKRSINFIKSTKNKQEIQWK